MNFQFIGILLLMVLPGITVADSAPSCSQLSTPREVLACALVRHPDAQRAEHSNIQANSLESEAEQRPNPELSAKSVFGQSLGDLILNHEVNLSHTIELGGKHGARVEKALATKSTIFAKSLHIREEILFKTLHTLYRIRQIRDEIEALDEALQTFSRIQKQFRSRPRLTPDQQVSLSVFDLAESDYRLRRSELENELSDHTLEIGLAVGQAQPISPQMLPNKRTMWPKIKAMESFSVIQNQMPQNATLQLATAELKLAESELLNAQSLSWPNLKVGPSFENQTSGPVSFFTVGVNVSFELPLFQVNGGGRALAHTGVALAEKNLSLKKEEISNQRATLAQRYNSTVKALESTLSEADLEKKHRSTDALFARGMIPSSLVIEAHRQVIDFTKNRNEQELNALETLWQIDILDGKPWEERL